MRLAKDGIFPIVRDQYGQLLPDPPASGLNLPGTIQGEGKLNGIPSLFIRMAGCNLRCCWQLPDGSISPCDTLYASYRIKHARVVSVEEIYRTIRQNTSHIRHIVITGGEPLLQAKELKELCMKLKPEKDYHFTLETNATLFDPELAAYIDLFSLSPKLTASHPGSVAQEEYQKPACIQSYIDYARRHHKDIQFKFVHACPQDISEIKELLSGLRHWNNEDILLMPVGGTPELQQRQQHFTLACCIENGWRYCERLHIRLFGCQAGV